MTVQETAKIMAVFKAAYPRYYANIDVKEARQVTTLWASMLADYSYETVSNAAKALIVSSKFPPTIAEVIEKIQLLTKEPELTEGGFDFVVMRELTGGLYFGDRKTVEENGVKKAIDTLTYDENEIRRIAKWGFDVAMKRGKKVCSVDKANVLDSSRLWRSVVEEVAKDYPEVELTHMLVDNCAMQLVRDPKQFDVILTENMFGDILSDEASMVTGSIGMLSSASLGATKLGLYEPSHGSAPDIAGQDKANPIATILSAAMMLRYSFDLEKEADAIENAVKQVLKDGYRTIDIMDEGKTQVGTIQMGDLIAERI